jgi:hypothetical protein
MAAAEDNVGSLEALALGLGRLLSPLEQDLADGKARVLLAQLGLQLPPSADGVGAFSQALGSVATAAGEMPGLIQKLIDDLGGDDYGNVAQTGTDLIKASISAIRGINDTAAAIRGLSGATGIAPATLNAFADQLPRRLIDFLIVRNLESAPVVAEALEFVGVVERNLVNPGSSDPALPEFTEYGFHVDQASAFVKSPRDRLRAMYDWGDAGFDGSKLLPVLQSLFGKAGFPAIVDDTVVPPVLDAIIFEASARTDLSPPGLEIRFAETIDVDNAVPFNQGGDWQLQALTSGDISAATALTLQPDGQIVLTPPSAMATGTYRLRFTAAQADGRPFLIFGDPRGSRLQVAKFVVEATAGLNFDSGNSASAGVFVGGEILGGKLRIDFSSADGFLGQILSGVDLESDFDLGFGVSSSEGVFLVGSAELEIQLPAHIDLGPVEIRALAFSAGIDGATFPIAVSAEIAAALGPIAVAVEGIGVSARLSVPANKNEGNLGPLQFEIGFKPPNGVGLGGHDDAISGHHGAELRPRRCCRERLERWLDWTQCRSTSRRSRCGTAWRGVRAPSTSTAR